MGGRLIGAGLALVLLSGCSAGPPGTEDEEPEPTAKASPTPQPSVAAAPDPKGAITTRPLYTEQITGEASVTLHRVDGDTMVARMKVRNEKGGGFRVWPALADQSGPIDHYPWNGFSGVAWLDPDGRSLHKPYFRPDRSCLCSTSGKSGKEERYLGEGEEIDVHAVLDAPPEDVKAVTLVTSLAEPFVDVPISDGAPDGVEFDDPEDEPDAEPETADLEAVTETRDSMVFDNADHWAVNLPADDLFFPNSARLTGLGTRTLEDMAKRMREERVTEAAIGGHTDDSDDASVSGPLSTAQAESVEKALGEGLKGRVALTAKGYGNGNPIADNGTDPGRERNRRITISLPKDQELHPMAPAPPSGSPSPGASPSPEPPDAPSPTPSTPLWNGPSPTPSAGPGDRRGKGRPAAEFAVTGAAAAGEEPRVDVALTGLRAVSERSALLGYEVTNPGDEEVLLNLDSVSDQWRAFRAGAAHAVYLDSPGDLRAHPVRVRSVDDEKAAPYCLCSSTSGISNGTDTLGPGQTRRFYAVLPIEPGAKAASVKIGVMPEMKGVRID
ncbi:OmpA family protein [Murinocardiopsis flavida]|uniref:OmpA family protein n=1 Tax=Murinocardiopsis flavida TaxID=645275 RepID=A0A2P8DR31_9ACTN|nr:OmpA family protein [Murinocardiopsis flavida]PSK99673.1 OmpA family protein [Murinocardiopsis flavida]